MKAKKMYLSPNVIEYGSIFSLTGIFGGATANDILLDTNGRVDGRGDGSIDACAQRGGKCICQDNNTC